MVEVKPEVSVNLADLGVNFPPIFEGKKEEIRIRININDQSIEKKIYELPEVSDYENDETTLEL